MYLILAVAVQGRLAVEGLPRGCSLLLGCEYLSQCVQHVLLLLMVLHAQPCEWRHRWCAPPAQAAAAGWTATASPQSLNGGGCQGCNSCEFGKAMCLAKTLVKQPECSMRVVLLGLQVQVLVTKEYNS